MNNLFMIIGRITKDIELRYTKDSKAVCDVNLAVNNAKDDTTFIKITIWNKLAETTAKYCKKGDMISASGIIKNHNWEDEKGKHYDYAFLTSRINFLQSKKNEEPDKTEEIKENDPFTEYGEQIAIDDTFLD